MRVSVFCLSLPFAVDLLIWMVLDYGISLFEFGLGHGVVGSLPLEGGLYVIHAGSN